MLDPRDLAPPVFLDRGRALGVRDESLRRLSAAIVGRGELERSAWVRDCQAPRRLLDQIPDPLPRLTLARSTTSPVDGFEKLLFKTPDDMRIETVLIPLHKPGAMSVCLSSQVGCPIGCQFCATGRMTRRRNLETWEIVDQFIQAREQAQATGRRVTGAVFMGMGEPFLNYDRVLAAAELLSCPHGASVAGAAITISTVGLVPQIERYTREKRRFRLSISLIAATDEKRSQLAPTTRGTPLAEIMAAAGRYALDRRDRVMLAYVCIGGFNVFESDALALARLIGDVKARLDLIDVTDTTGVYRRPDPDEYRLFRDVLGREYHQPVVRRYSGGADIQAACGTLAALDGEPAHLVASAAGGTGRLGLEQA